MGPCARRDDSAVVSKVGKAKRALRSLERCREMVGTALCAFAHPMSVLLRRQLPRRRRRVDEIGGQLRVARFRIRYRFLLHRAVTADAVGQ